MICKLTTTYKTVLWITLLIALVSPADVDLWARTQRTNTQKKEREKPVYSKTSKVEMSISYDFTVPGKTPKIQLIVALPKTIPDRQRIYDIECSPKPTRLFTENENDYAEFLFTNPEKQFKVQINIKAGLFRYDLSIARKKHTKNPPPDPNADSFLKNEKYIEKDDPKIQQIARDIKGNNKAAIIKNIHDYVVRNMDYSLNKGDLGALVAAEKKTGDCSEYADLFVAICRAKNIPARVVIGYTTEATLTPRHAWAEVYMRRYGWVPFDPTWADVKFKSARQFHYLKSVYIYLTHTRHDPVLGGGYYSSCRYLGDSFTMKDSVEFK
jgi:transglutaminase-like putative cysteine protease